VRADLHAPLSDTGKARLKAMAETTDGFEIARRDLRDPRPGEFLGRAPVRRAAAAFPDLTEDQPLVRASAQARRAHAGAPRPRAASTSALARRAGGIPKA
jgi:ATP-dependent DNA helicase RecG